MLSIVVPVLNEEESLGELRAQIAATCDERGIDWELILVDDGSTDDTAGRVRQQFPAVVVLEQGRTAALGQRSTRAFRRRGEAIWAP